MPNLISIVVGKEKAPTYERPKISITDFGSIKSAELSLAPLTLLVGKNNTGKSYIASMIWAIRSLSNVGFRLGEGDALKAPSWFGAMVAELQPDDEHGIEIDGARVSRHLNRYFSRQKDAIASVLMSLPGMTVGSFNISLQGSLYLTKLDKPPKLFGSMFHAETENFRFSWKESRSKRIQVQAASMSNSHSDSLADQLFRTVVSIFVGQNLTNFYGGATYIPAARTGLMLSLGYISSSLIGNLSLFSEKQEQGRFSLPTLRFLQTLTREHISPRVSPIADFLEESVLCGKISRDNTNTTNFLYTPGNSDQALPMHAVSSMVSELSPILTVLRSGGLEQGLILEEPEAHLHLAAQRSMARAIARLVNANVPVVLTTHSDTFVQQLNLLIQMGSSIRGKKLANTLGYEKSELLDFESVECYEFIKGDFGTDVRKSRKSEHGFVVESINDTLIDLAGEALQIDEANG